MITIEEVKELCRSFGYSDVGTNYDLVRWLRERLARTNKLERALSEKQVELEHALGNLHDYSNE